MHKTIMGVTHFFFWWGAGGCHWPEGLRRAGKCYKSIYSYLWKGMWEYGLLARSLVRGGRPGALYY